MASSRITLLIFVCVSGVWFSRISGEEVQMRVRPGDDVIIYSDCVWKSGLNTVWFRNCSHHPPPPFKISTLDLMQGARLRYSMVWNSANQTHDLLVKNVSESDLGLYYCALHQRKITENDEGKGGVPKDVYRYGNRTTRLSFLDTTQRPSSTPPVSDCSICCKLLASVCPVCVLLSCTCVYCIYCNRSLDSEERSGLLTENVYQVGGAKEHQCRRSMKGKFCFHTEVSYTPLNSDLKSD